MRAASMSARAGSVETMPPSPHSRSLTIVFGAPGSQRSANRDSVPNAIIAKKSLTIGVRQLRSSSSSSRR
jgi:hypothetical protein